MVHIPLVGIDVPEPKLGQILPSVFEFVMRVLSRLLDAGQDFVNPLSPEAAEIHFEAVALTVAPEFHPVIKRLQEGKILDTEQLSSEADEASFDYYRRAIRIATTGYPEEGLQDRALRRMDMEDEESSSRIRPLQEVWMEHHHDQRVQLLCDGGSGGGASSSEAPELLPLDVERLLVEYADREYSSAVLQQRAQALAQERAQLARAVRSGRKQAVITTANAGVGLALGLSLARGLGALALKLMKRRRKLQKKQRLAAAKAAAEAGLAAAAAAGGAGAAGSAATAAAGGPSQPVAAAGQAAPARRTRPVRTR